MDLYEPRPQLYPVGECIVTPMGRCWVVRVDHEEIELRTVENYHFTFDWAVFNDYIQREIFYPER